MQENLILIIELIGTVAFAASGSVIALEKKLDLFGVISLSVITSTFGGIFRDLLLGITPPTSFRKPIYMTTAIITSFVIFAMAWSLHKHGNGYEKLKSGDFLLFWMDALGLGIFSAMGVYAAYIHGGADNEFLCVCCGLFTGVGGGVIRDTVVDQLPAVFTRHVYAVASIAGAIVTYMLMEMGMTSSAIWIGTIVVVLLRYFAKTFLWNLPRIDDYN